MCCTCGPAEPSRRPVRSAGIAGNEAFPVEWTGQQVVVTLPEHIDVTGAAQVRELLLSVINRGAVVLIACRARPISPARWCGNNACVALQP